MWKIRIPASTSNLGPGFDTLGLAIKIYNIIRIERQNKDTIEVRYTHPVNVGFKPTDDLFIHAYKIACKMLGFAPEGLMVEVNNNIPAGAGLGSSATAVLGGIITAILLSGKKIDYQQVLDMAITIEKHPDNITPCLMGGFTVSGVVDGHVYYNKFSLTRDVKLLIAIPDFIVRTREARSVLPERFKLEDVVFNINRASYLVSAFIKRDLRNIQWAFQDRIHQPTRSKLVPGLEEIIDRAHKAGALGCFLSGAGPSVVALYEKNQYKIGRAITMTWKQYRVKSRIILSEIDNDGVKIIR